MAYDGFVFMGYIQMRPLSNKSCRISWSLWASDDFGPLVHIGGTFLVRFSVVVNGVTTWTDNEYFDIVGLVPLQDVNVNVRAFYNGIYRTNQEAFILSTRCGPIISEGIE